MKRALMVPCLALVALAGCKSRQATQPPRDLPDASAARHDAEVASTDAKAGLPWIEDDFDAAMARAKETGKPLVIDFWAPWCHTCLSMKSFVFPDPALAPVADRFEWLAVNTENPANADALARFPVNVWPTFYVVNPADETIHGRWLGAASLAQFRRFVTDAELSASAGRGTTLPEGDPLRVLVKAHQASLAGEQAAAAKHFGAALGAAPADWPRRPDALVGRIEALYRAGKYDACLDVARAHLGDTGDSVSATDFTYFAHACLGKSSKQDDTLLARMDERLAALTANAAAPLSADDRGDAYGLLMRIREDRGRPDAALDAARDRLAMLEDAAEQAPDAKAAATYAWALADTHLALSQGDKAVAMLQDIEKDLPDDYNIPYWLARVHQRLEDHEAALAASDRSLALVYGPRKGRILELRAELYEALGKPDRACDAVRAQSKLYAELPDAQVTSKMRESAAQRTAALCSAERPVDVGRLHPGR